MDHSLLRYCQQYLAATCEGVNGCNSGGACEQAGMHQGACQTEAVSLDATFLNTPWLSWMSGLSWQGQGTGPVVGALLQMLMLTA